MMQRCRRLLRGGENLSRSTLKEGPRPGKMSGGDYLLEPLQSKLKVRGDFFQNF